MEAIAAMLTERPYVVAFLLSFLLVAWAERGWQRALFWLASGIFLGWLMEFSSVRTGFPFGFYTYHEENFPRELWIGDIPFFASLSFAFLTYFGYSVACTLLSPLRRQGWDIQRQAPFSVDGSLLVLLLAASLITLTDTVMDPVTHLGRYWFLGDLYAYEGRGFHFDVPLSNYAGWFFTSLLIIFVNQRFDAWLSSARAQPAQGFYLPFKPFWALGSLIGNYAFMLGVTLYLIGSDGVPASEPVGQILVSGLALSGLLLAFVVVMVRRGLTLRGAQLAPES